MSSVFYLFKYSHFNLRFRFRNVFKSETIFNYFIMWKYIKKTLPTSVKVFLFFVVLADLLILLFDYLPKLLK